MLIRFMLVLCVSKHFDMRHFDKNGPEIHAIYESDDELPFPLLSVSYKYPSKRVRLLLAQDMISTYY